MQNWMPYQDLPPPSTQNLRRMAFMEVLIKLSIDRELDSVLQIDHELSWMDPIIKYLRDGKLPQGKKKARKMAYRVACYTLIVDRLYKISFTLPYLRCLESIKV